MRPMNRIAPDITAEDFVLFTRVLDAEVDKFRTLGDGERARRLIAVGAWISEEWLMLAAARASLAHQLLNGGPSDPE